MSDDCFDGTLLPDVKSIAETGVWRWYILEQRLQVGSNCIFTARYKTITGQEISDLRMNTSCSITKKSKRVVVCSGYDALSCVVVTNTKIMLSFHLHLQWALPRYVGS